VNSQWLLPDDGIIDPVAVEIAAAGTRRVRLTVPERRFAAALVLARGGSVNDIAARLHMSSTSARRLARILRSAADASQPGAAALPLGTPVIGRDHDFGGVGMVTGRAGHRVEVQFGIETIAAEPAYFTAVDDTPRDGAA
jgi:hypothetical protein